MKTISDYLSPEKITEFNELMNLYVKDRFPYRYRLNLKGKNQVFLAKKALNHLGIALDDELTRLLNDVGTQKKIINLWIIANRITTNTMSKLLFIKVLNSDLEFWSGIPYEVKTAIIEFYTKATLSWGMDKLTIATVKNKVNDTTKFSKSIEETFLKNINDFGEEIGFGIPNNLTSSNLTNDAHVDNFYWERTKTTVRTLLEAKGIYSDDLFNKLAIPMFHPNNEPTNPLSTENAEDAYVDIFEKTIRYRDTATGEVVQKKITYKGKFHVGENRQPVYKDRGWILEWAPEFSAGFLRMTVEEMYPEKLAPYLLNILSLEEFEATDKLDTYLQGIHYMPMSSAHLVLLQDFSVARRVIVNQKITLGSKYIQSMAEAFPQFSATITVARFGDLHMRVLNFLDALIAFTANPRKYPGKVYLYDAFNTEFPKIMPSMWADKYRDKYYKKYHIIPISYTKRANSTNNTMIDIVLTGLVLSTHERE